MAIATNIIQLRPEIITEIKKNLQVKNRLQFELNKSFLTIQRWLNDNSSNLTTATALKIIAEELGKSNDELLTESE